MTYRGRTPVVELLPMTKSEIFSLAWFCLLRTCGASEGRGVSRGGGGFPFTSVRGEDRNVGAGAASVVKPAGFCPAHKHVDGIVAKVLSRQPRPRDAELAQKGSKGAENKTPEVVDGDSLYVATLCHLTVLHDEDEHIAARLDVEQGVPASLHDALVQGVLRPLEVTHGRQVVEALVMQLVAATTGVSRADLKTTLAHQLQPLRTQGWLPAADLAIDSILTAIEPFLLPPQRPAEDSLCFEHRSPAPALHRRWCLCVRRCGAERCRACDQSACSCSNVWRGVLHTNSTLRLAAWRHYDPMAAPLDDATWGEEDGVEETKHVSKSGLPSLSCRIQRTLCSACVLACLLAWPACARDALCGK